MLDASAYVLPEQPKVEDYDNQKTLNLAMQTYHRDVQREWSNLLRDAQRESRRPFSIARFNSQIRAFALIIIILAIVVMPILALLKGISTITFSQYIAPLTGIGGVIIGYWFGQSKDDSSTPWTAGKGQENKEDGAG
jgi:hypothetical protein